MRRNYRYILVFLSLVIVYELYLIFSYKYVDLQKDVVMENIEADMRKLRSNIDEKKDYYAYINTTAYKDMMAKSSQNKRNPGEEVVFIVTKEEAEQYKKIDVQNQMYMEKEIKSPTYGMSNWQKWIFYIFKKDIRD